jgi:peptide-methionine (S)-S-oxide reductase
VLFSSRAKLAMPTAENALAGRPNYLYTIPSTHAVLGTSLQGPWPGMEIAHFGLGCFWGAERIFWQRDGVHSTAAGYEGGFTAHPTYEEVCTGMTGHNETVQVVFDPAQVSYAELVALFFESHDPTQGFRQGNDIGTQYRSGIYTLSHEQLDQALPVRASYQSRLDQAGYGAITTEIVPAGTFYYAEDYHQQYLHKVPNGYCGIGGTGVSCPVGLGA